MCVRAARRRPGSAATAGALADAAVDARVVASAVALALGTRLMIALVPALRASCGAPVYVVGAGVRGAVGARRGGLRARSLWGRRRSW